MLVLDNVRFSAEENGAEKEIIKGISLELKEDFIALTGPNGSGKSTLARLIMGIYKPTSGRIYFDGKDITDLKINERANLGLGFAFQQPVRFKGLTVKDLISIASGRELNVSEVCDYLSEVGLCARDYVDREVNASLSGGELKRIEIASVMARKSKLFLFDEPEAGIDLWSFTSLIRVFDRHFSSGKDTRRGEAHYSFERRQSYRRRNQRAGLKEPCFQHDLCGAEGVRYGVQRIGKEFIEDDRRYRKHSDGGV